MGANNEELRKLLNEKIFSTVEKGYEKFSNQNAGVYHAVKSEQSKYFNTFNKS